MRLLVWLFVVIAAFSVPTEAMARRTNPLVVFPPKPERLRAVRYARIDGTRCAAEARERGIQFAPAEHATIKNAVLLTGALRGVRFQRVFEPHDAPELVLDCGFLLALDDLATVLADHGFAEVRYSSVHRKRGRRGGRGHAAGLAIDINELVHSDGTVYSVLRDFERARIGAKTCGAGAPSARGAKARTFRELVCALDDAGSFNLILTPHYDYRHRNHLHLEVRRGIDWFLTQ